MLCWCDIRWGNALLSVPREAKFGWFSLGAQQMKWEQQTNSEGLANALGAHKTGIDEAADVAEFVLSVATDL